MEGQLGVRASFVLERPKSRPPFLAFSAGEREPPLSAVAHLGAAYSTCTSFLRCTPDKGTGGGGDFFAARLAIYIHDTRVPLDTVSRKEDLLSPT